MMVDLQKDRVVRAYGRWAPVYDLLFGQVSCAGRRAAIDAAQNIGGRILEVGVGTGLSLLATLQILLYSAWISPAEIVVAKHANG